MRDLRGDPVSSNIPFIDMAEYFRGLKTAEDAKAPAPAAAPPPEQVLPMYAQLANLKTSLAMAYRVYSESLRGEANTALGEHFKEHSEHHLEDADWFIRRCSVLGGPTDFGEIQLPPPATDTQTIVRTLASLEEQSIAALNELRPLVEGSPSQYELEGMLSRDQHHLDDMWQHIPDTPATSAVQPAGPPPPPAPAESVPKQANTVGAVAATGKHAPVQAPPALQGAAAGQHPVKMAWIKTAARTYDLGEGTARDGNAFAVKSEPSQLELAMALQGKMDGDFHAAKGHGKHLTMFSPAALGGGGAIELGAHNHGTLIPAGGATRGHLLKQYGKGPSISPAMMDSIERNDGDVREQLAMNGVKVGRNLRLEAALGHIKKAAFRTDEENVETGRQRAIANLSSGFTSDRYTSGERHGQLLGKLTGAGAGALAGAMAARKESIPVRLAAGLGAGALGGSLGGALGKVVGQDRDATNFYREHSKEAACLGDVAEEMRPAGRILADAQKLTQGLGESFELGGRNPKDAKSSWNHPKRHPSVKEASLKEKAVEFGKKVIGGKSREALLEASGRAAAKSDRHFDKAGLLRRGMARSNDTSSKRYVIAREGHADHFQKGRIEGLEARALKGDADRLVGDRIEGGAKVLGVLGSTAGAAGLLVHQTKNGGQGGAKEASDPFTRMMQGWAKTANALVHEPDPAVAEYIAREEQARMQQEAQESEYLRSQLQAAHAELESKDQEVQQLQQSVGQLQEQTQMQQDTIATAQATTEGAMGSVVQKSNELMKQMQLTSNLSQAHQMMKEQLQSLAQMPSPPLTGGESAATDQAASDELAMQDQAAAEQEAAAAGQQPGVPAEGGSPPPGGQGEAGPPKVAGLPHGLLGGGIGALAGAGSVLLASKERAKIDELIGKMEQSDSKGFSHAMALAHLKHQSNLAQIAADHPGRSALVAGVLGGQAGMGVESNIRHLLKGEPYHPLHNAELK
jgi:bacterioferritin (cytochrome b1)